MAGDKKDENFSSFQIGSMPGFGPGATTGGSSAPRSSAAAPTVGGARQLPDPPAEKHFPTLEDLIESDNEEIAAFAEEMGLVCQQLDELVEKRSGRVKQEAQRARQAYELIFSLIDELLEVKAHLLSPPEAEGEG